MIAHITEFQKLKLAIIFKIYEFDHLKQVTKLK